MTHAVLTALLLLGADAQRDVKSRIVVDVNRVDVQFTVTDRRGRFAGDLTRDQFEIAEDGRPQKILGFNARGEVPLRLAVALDTSNSVRERFRFIQDAATSFLSTAVRPKVDRALVMTFDTRVEQAVAFSDDLEKLTGTIRELRPGGGTSLFDAIYYACRDKLAAEPPREQCRRAVVIVSDGDDNQSTYTRGQALEMAQKADATIYAVSTNSDRTESYGDKVLKFLAEQTGGQVYFPFKMDDLNRSFQQLATELRHQYNIYYRPEPAKADGAYHTITVTVKGRKDLVVRTRKGYYAPKASAL